MSTCWSRVDGLPVPEQSHYIRPGALAVGQPIWCIRCRRAGHLDTASLTRVMMVTAGGLSCTRREWCLEGLPPPPGRTGPTTAEYPAVGCRQVKGLSGRLYRRLARSPSTHCFCFFLQQRLKTRETRPIQAKIRSKTKRRDQSKNSKKAETFLGAGSVSSPPWWPVSPPTGWCSRGPPVHQLYCL